MKKCGTDVLFNILVLTKTKFEISILTCDSPYKKSCTSRKFLMGIEDEILRTGMVEHTNEGKLKKE